MSTTAASTSAGGMMVQSVDEAHDASVALQSALAKIRHHTASKLDNQRAPAQLLIAIEQTLQETSTTRKDEKEKGDDGSGAKMDTTGTETSIHAGSTQNRKPVEYFLALDSMLKAATSPKASPTLLPSTLYLLSLVAPYVSAGVLRARLSSLVAAIATVLSNPHPAPGSGTAPESHAALLRSALGITQALLVALNSDGATLERDLALRGCWNSILDLCTDSRPKVRRRAQDLVSTILLPDGLPAKVGGKQHPYAAQTAEWTVRSLQHVADSGGVTSNATAKKGAVDQNKFTFDKKLGKAKGSEAAAAFRQQSIDGGASTGIWVCGFAKGLVTAIPTKSINALCSVLLRLPALQNPFLTVAAFEVFQDLLKSSRPASPLGRSNPLASFGGTAPSATLVAQDTLTTTLRALRFPTMVPSSNDSQLIPSYLTALEHAMVAYSRVESGSAAWKIVPEVWSDVLELSLSNRSEASRKTPAVRLAGQEALCAVVRYCISDAGIDEALAAHAQGGPRAVHSTALGGIVASIEEALGKQALRYNHARAEILVILTALVSRLRYRPASPLGSSKKGKLPAARSEAAATTILLPLVQTIGTLRSQPRFEHREHADAVLGTAVEVCGPRAFLSVLPLGLLGENGADEEAGRAWLLPLMRTRITNTELGHFTKTMVPLSEKLFNRRMDAEKLNAEGKPSRPIEAKVYEALVEQIWALFPAYCDLPVDLQSALTPQVAELLSNVLYTQPQLRPVVLRGLQNLVERNEALSASGAPSDMLLQSFGVNQDIGKKNLDHLRSMGMEFLSVFFNVFSQSPGESRGFVADCLSAYLRIASPADVVTTYDKVVSLLGSSLPELVPVRDRETGHGVLPPVPHTMLDLLIVLVPFLDASKPTGAAHLLFELVVSDALLRCNDAGVQKKTYRLLCRLLDGKRGALILRTASADASTHRVAELLQRIREATSDVVPGAKRDRIALLATLVPHIPQDQLHILPSIIPEAVLGTKETNQGAREVAYELLVLMARKMEEGGVIKRGLLEGAAGAEGADDAQMTDAHEATASVEEYITMVAAGLAGASAHMISATLTALARLLYEFRASLSRPTLDELLTTLELFLRSPNREIVKAALGLVKVSILTLDHELVDKHLATLVPGLLGWSKEHKQHFKSKVRHIFERLLRRFGYDRVLEVTGEEDRKLITNIRKRKERARRQKAALEDGEEQGEEEGAKKAAGLGVRALKTQGNDAFEEALYGSESDLSGSEEEGSDEGPPAAGKNTKGAAQLRGKGAASAKPARRARDRGGDQEYIVEDDDEPMDLLDRSAVAGGRITMRDPQAANARRRAPGVEASKFELDEATGRMIIDEDGADNTTAAQAAADVDGAGRAYVDKERGVDGVTMRGGVARFNKNNKRAREQEAEMDEEQMAREEAAATAAAGGAGARRDKEKKQKRAKVGLGAEFKAKRAEGDVTRNGKSPYAYVPLSQVAGKKNKSKNRDGAREVSLTNQGGKAKSKRT